MIIERNILSLIQLLNIIFTELDKVQEKMDLPQIFQIILMILIKNNTIWKLNNFNHLNGNKI